MEIIKERLAQEQKRISELLAKSNRNISRNINVSNYHVQQACRNGYEQYYLYNPKTKARTYIKHDKLKSYSKVMQRDYDLTVHKQLLKKSKIIENLLKHIDELSIDDIKKMYSDMPTLKRDIITPIIETDEQFIARWRESHPANQNTYPQEGIYQTNRGEYVRSKSEKIIADALDKYGVPYQYEPLLELSGYNITYPDFIVLNKRTREEFYWEHLGLVSDTEYATKNFRKLQKYEESGYSIGKNLIATMESVEMPLKTKMVETKIKDFLL